jgi:hypothetical protein
MASAAKTNRQKTRDAKRGSANRMAVVNGTQSGLPARDPGSPWLANHHVIRPAETLRAGVNGYTVVDQLEHDRLWHMNRISVRQWRAADELLRQFHKAKIQAPSTGAYDGSGSGSKGRKHGARPKDATPNSDALNRYLGAIQFIGVRDGIVARAIAIENRRCTEARDMAGRKGDAVLVVRQALEALADYWHNVAKVPGMEPGADDGQDLQNAVDMT